MSNAYQTVGKPLAHESARMHVTGQALYTDDLPEQHGTLHAALGLSQRAHAEIVSLDLSQVKAAPGVVAVVSLDDVPGEKYIGSYVQDEPVLADGCVQYVGQPIFAVAATSHDAARRAARLARVEYRELEPVLTADEGAERESYVLPPIRVGRGNVPAELDKATHRHQGRLYCGGQEQFYLEGQVAYAQPGENDEMLVYSSTQHPAEMQSMIAHMLGRPLSAVKVQCRRMGGGFGGKESQSWPFATVAALLAWRTGRPVKLRPDRDDDIMLTGKRHDFSALYDVAYDDQGVIAAVTFEQRLRCGYSADLSGAVSERQVFHSDNAYYLPVFDVLSLCVKTNTQSNTAFRGFGGPQGILCIEYVIDDIARRLGLDPLDVRKRNFYGVNERNVTPYDMVIEDNVIHPLVDQLETSSNYRERREEIRRFNAENKVLKKGLALVPVKFGISFTTTHLNQGGALVHVYTDGSILVTHGAAEMGQGVNTKVAQVVAEEFGVDFSQVRSAGFDTSKVANTSATAASMGTDLSGKAAQDACRKILTAMKTFAADHYGCDESDIVFRDGQVHCGSRTIPFRDFVKSAYLARLPLWSSGYYKVPKIHYDKKTMRGRPFFYNVYAAACAEVVIDTLTGENRLLRTDILYDAGRPINPAVDIGQIEGGFIQGVGWLTSEELWWDEQGALKTHAPSTYKIPAVSDCPEQFNVEFFDNGNAENSVYQSKAMGEPPLPLAISVFLALRDAIASVAKPGSYIALDAPATAERVLQVLDEVAPDRFAFGASAPARDDAEGTALSMEAGEESGS